MNNKIPFSGLPQLWYFITAVSPKRTILSYLSHTDSCCTDLLTEACVSFESPLTHSFTTLFTVLSCSTHRQADEGSWQSESYQPSLAQEGCTSSPCSVAWDTLHTLLMLLYDTLGHHHGGHLLVK